MKLRKFLRGQGAVELALGLPFLVLLLFVICQFARVFYVAMGVASAVLLLHADSAARTAPRATGQPATSPAEDQPAPADLVALGKRIFHDTPREAKPYVGNRLSCNDCHFQDGTKPYSSPLIGVADIFPWFSERANRKITLKERIQECFVRSENGHPLPEEGKEMSAMVKRSAQT